MLEKIISLLPGITIEKAQVYSNALKAVMYRGIMILLARCIDMYHVSSYNIKEYHDTVLLYPIVTCLFILVVASSAAHHLLSVKWSCQYLGTNADSTCVHSLSVCTYVRTYVCMYVVCIL